MPTTSDRGQRLPTPDFQFGDAILPFTRIFWGQLLEDVPRPTARLAGWLFAGLLVIACWKSWTLWPLFGVGGFFALITSFFYTLHFSMPKDHRMEKWARTAQLPQFLATDAGVGRVMGIRWDARDQQFLVSFENRGEVPSPQVLLLTEEQEVDIFLKENL